MDKNFSFVIGRAAALAIAIVTIVLAIYLIWEVINLSEFAKNLGYAASIFLAISVVIMMACFYDVTAIFQQMCYQGFNFEPFCFDRLLKAQQNSNIQSNNIKRNVRYNEEPLSNADH